MKILTVVLSAVLIFALCLPALTASAARLYPEAETDGQNEEKIDLITALQSGEFTSLHPVSTAFIVISALFVAAAAFVIITGKKAGK